MDTHTVCFSFGSLKIYATRQMFAIIRNDAMCNFVASAHIVTTNLFIQSGLVISVTLESVNNMHSFTEASTNNFQLH